MSKAAEKQCCPLCGSNRHMGKESVTLYENLVCKRCSSEFAKRRAFAFILDCILVGLFSIIGIILLGVAIGFLLYQLQESGTIGWRTADDLGVRLIVALLFLIPPVLFYFKDGFSGSSIGKRIMGVRAIDSRSSKPIGFGASFKRNFPLSIFPPVFILYALTQLSKGQRIGDGWANSRVIWEKHRDKPPFAVSR